MKKYFYYLMSFLLLNIFSCKKKDVEPEAVPQNCKMNRVEVVEGDSITNIVLIEYNSQNNAEYVFDIYGSDTIVTRYFFDVEGRVIKSIPFYDENDPNTEFDVHRFKYDELGRKYEQIYTTNSLKDSTVYTYPSPTKVIETNYRYSLKTASPPDTTITIYEADENGNLITESSDRFLDSMVVMREYSYYPQDRPDSYGIKESSFFNKKSLVKSEVSYNRSYSYGVTTVSTNETQYTYEYDKYGKIVKRTTSYKSGSESKFYDMNFYYHCN